MIHHVQVEATFPNGTEPGDRPSFDPMSAVAAGDAGPRPRQPDRRMVQQMARYRSIAAAGRFPLAGGAAAYRRTASAEEAS